MPGTVPRSRQREIDLRADERALLLAIENELRRGACLLPGVPVATSRAVQVVMVRRGVLPVRLRRMSGQLCFCVPRGLPVVQQMVRAFAHDPRNIYPILPVLLGGHDGYGARKGPLQQAFLAAAG